MPNLASIAAKTGQLETSQRQREQIDYEQRALEKQKDFATFQEQLRIEGEKRSQQWELEKMVMSSQYDFLWKEKWNQYIKDQKMMDLAAKADRIDKQIDELNKYRTTLAGDHPARPAFDKAYFDLMFEKNDIDTKFSTYDIPTVKPPSYLQPQIPSTAMQAQLLEEMGWQQREGMYWPPVTQPTTQPAAPTESIFTTRESPTYGMGIGVTGQEQPAGQAAFGTIRVISPDGKQGTIPIEDWAEAEKAGYKRL